VIVTVIVTGDMTMTDTDDDALMAAMTRLLKEHLEVTVTVGPTTNPAGSSVWTEVLTTVEFNGTVVHESSEGVDLSAEDFNRD
jgi:hypothetical protein